MLYIILAFIIGFAISKWYQRKFDNPIIYRQGYHRGWKNRHQGFPLLPRFWIDIRFLNQTGPTDPYFSIDEYEWKGLNYENGNEDERLANGLLPYCRPTGMEYAISDKELTLLHDASERIWRGLDVEETESDYESRTPPFTALVDIYVLLRYGFAEKDIERYYGISNLTIERGIMGRIKKIYYNRNGELITRKSHKDWLTWDLP